MFLALLGAQSPVPAQWSNDPNVNTPICMVPGNQTFPVIVSDGSGGAIITWRDLRNGNYDIYAQSVNASGDTLWKADGVAICTATGAQFDPFIASDDSGGAIITWEDTRSGSNHIYAQRVSASGAVPWTTDGVAICTNTQGSQANPTIVSDGSGGAIITWYDSRNGQLDIYAQRVDASGAMQWTVDGVAICTFSGNKQYPTIASDGSGGAIITWHDYRSFTNYDIYAQHVNASGTIQWTADGVAIDTATGDQTLPIIVPDGSGGAIITCQDARNGSSNVDIYAQHVNASGAVQWTANGVAIDTATGNQTLPTIVPDGSGGAIITCQDARNGSSNVDIYAQHVNASGAVQWTANGVAVCTATGNQLNPTIASDGSGGATITWQDLRSGVNYDIYAQQVNASGAVQGTTNGVAICTAAGNQLSPTIVSDGLGGAIITWYDLRNGNDYNIYAQHVAPDVSLPIQLASMTATTLTTGAQLDWTTVSETNSLGFYVERKGQNDGAYATVSNLIPGAGTSLQEHNYQWTDTKVTNGVYNYRLRSVDLDGTTTYSNAITVKVSGVLGVGDTRSLPTQFALQQNYPNPFNPSTVINYELPKAVYVRLVVYDMLGREVATLINGTQDAGYKSVQFNAANLPSGIYTYRLTAGTYVEVKKMALLK